MRPFSPRCVTCVAAALPLLLPGVSIAGNHYVDQNASAAVPDGASWCSAFVSLDDALAVAAAGDIIRVADGTYRPSVSGLTDSRDAQFPLVTGVTLIGGYAGCGAPIPDQRDVDLFVTILDGDLAGDDDATLASRVDNSYHVVTATFVNASTVLDGFTIRGGYAVGSGVGPSPESRDQGSGLNNYWGTPTIRNCAFIDNFAFNHGTLNDHGGATIENCSFVNNLSNKWAAGLFVFKDITATVRDCSFVGNVSAGQGGAVYLRGATNSTFTDCLFQDNEAEQQGGAMYCDIGSRPVLTRCTFDGNQATAVFPEDRRGGGIYHVLSTPTLVDCMFTRNRAFLGSGMYNDASLVTLTGCAFVDNRGPTGGERDRNGAIIFPGGGGIYSTNATSLLVSGCEFTRDTVNRRGGALYADANCYVDLRDSTFSACSSYYGPLYISSSSLFVDRCMFSLGHGNASGAMFLATTEAVVLRSTFVANASRQHSAGAITTRRDLTMVGCKFLGNSGAGPGGALGFHSGDLTLTNCLFGGNQSQLGAAVSLEWQGGTVIRAFLNNCTFSGNVAVDGGTVAMLTPGGAGQTQVFLEAENTIFWDDLDAADDTGLGRTSATINHSNIRTGWPGVENLSIDPQFVDPSGPDGVVGTLDDDLTLTSPSPCIDAGDNASLPMDTHDMDDDGDLFETIPIDLAGQTRIDGASVDMGAYEFIADCNENGIPDSEDLASGASIDCNANSIPDECEADCNGNGVADGCETDADLDGLIDECDGCPSDSGKIAPGLCGCGVPDVDSDNDTVLDCFDVCAEADDRVDTDMDGTPDGCDLCGGFFDALDCNANQVPDGCDITSGTSVDLDGDGIPDECSLAPALQPGGSRYVLVAPVGGPDPIALRVTSPDSPCFDLYVQANGSLGLEPAWRFAFEWGVVSVHDARIVPSTAYQVETVFPGPTPEGILGPMSATTTAVWGDTIGMFTDGAWEPPDGVVNITDAVASLERFSNRPSAPPLEWVDLEPEMPDGVINITDVVMVIDAFRSAPYPFASLPPCP